MKAPDKFPCGCVYIYGEHDVNGRGSVTWNPCEAHDSSLLNPPGEVIELTKLRTVAEKWRIEHDFLKDRLEGKDEKIKRLELKIHEIRKLFHRWGLDGLNDIAFAGLMSGLLRNTNEKGDVFIAFSYTEDGRLKHRMTDGSVRDTDERSKS